MAADSPPVTLPTFALSTLTDDDQERAQKAIDDLNSALEQRKSAAAQAPWFAAASGFLQPTRSGRTGESLGNAVSGFGAARTQEAQTAEDVARARLGLQQMVGAQHSLAPVLKNALGQAGGMPQGQAQPMSQPPSPMGMPPPGGPPGAASQQMPGMPPAGGPAGGSVGGPVGGPPTAPPPPQAPGGPPLGGQVAAQQPQPPQSPPMTWGQVAGKQTLKGFGIDLGAEAAEKQMESQQPKLSVDRSGNVINENAKTPQDVYWGSVPFKGPGDVPMMNYATNIGPLAAPLPGAVSTVMLVELAKRIAESGIKEIKYADKNGAPQVDTVPVWFQKQYGMPITSLLDMAGAANQTPPPGGQPPPIPGSAPAPIVGGQPPVPNPPATPPQPPQPGGMPPPAAGLRPSGHLPASQAPAARAGNDPYADMVPPPVGTYGIGSAGMAPDVQKMREENAAEVPKIGAQFAEEASDATKIKYILDLMKKSASESPGGRFAPTRQFFEAARDSLELPISDDAITDYINGTNQQKMTSQLAAAQQKSLSGRAPVFEFANWLKNLPNRSMTPQEFTKVADDMGTIIRRSMDKNAAWMHYSSQPNLSPSQLAAFPNVYAQHLYKTEGAQTWQDAAKIDPALNQVIRKRAALGPLSDTDPRQQQYLRNYNRERARIIKDFIPAGQPATRPVQ